jgi:PAS domain S-box-containing protein
MPAVHEPIEVESVRHRGERLFRDLLEKLPSAAYTCDCQGLITYFNRLAVELWGRAPRLNDPVDRFCGSFRLFAPDGSPIAHAQCWMALALQGNREYNGQEIVVERPDGSRRTALEYANPIHDESGRLSGAVNVLVDISERKQAEDVLREADRKKGEFLALLAHELRNPLAPLRNGLQIIRLASNDSAAIDRARAMMERQLSHMVRLIDDLLDLSRMNTGKIALHKERIDLGTVVQDAVDAARPLIESAGHHFTIKLSPRPIFIDGDRTRLSQVFANLLNNSAKYTERGGHIQLIVEQQGSDAVVTVTDNGVGIPADLLPQIFDMFIQVDEAVGRAQGGLGIGLNLVRGLVEMHAGRVEVSSAGPGQGSEFAVRLPVALPLPCCAGPGGTTENATPGGSRRRILVVDDNRDSATSLALMLKIMGHETAAAYDGVEAVDAAASFRPDIVLLDIGLPRLNGYDACRQIREQAWGKETVMIAVSGWGQREDKDRSRQAGFNFHLVKPLEPAALERLLTGLLLKPA